MTIPELLAETKIGLGIPVAQTTFDGVLTQKIKTVIGYMTAAGISATQLASDEAVGAIVLGVTDIWNIQGGDAKFSALFHSLLTQLAVGSLPAENEVL